MIVHNFEQQGCSEVILLNSEVIACTSGHNVNVYEIEKPQFPIKQLKGHKAWVADILEMNEGKTIVSADWGRQVKIWDWKEETCLKTFDNQDRFINRLMILNWGEGKMLVTVSKTRMMMLHPDSGEVVQQCEAKGVLDLIKMSDGLLLGGGTEGKFVIYRAV